MFPRVGFVLFIAGTSTNQTPHAANTGILHGSVGCGTPRQLEFWTPVASQARRDSKALFHSDRKICGNRRHGSVGYDPTGVSRNASDGVACLPLLVVVLLILSLAECGKPHISSDDRADILHLERYFTRALSL